MDTRYLFAALIVAGSALSSAAGESPSKEQIAKLIEQLGSSTFAERDKATKELAAIGVPALEALRKAAKSDDAEVRKRAEELLPKIEIQAESIRVLAPKRVHLVYKDTPLRDAAADFQKKSGCTIDLHDPDGKLKQRKITLDSGETSFWRAVTLFCDKAELSEASIEDLMQALQQRGGGAGAPAGIGRPGRVFMSGLNEQLILKDGKAKQLPADDRGAVRVRALARNDLVGKVPQGEVIVPLEVTPEPKLKLQILQSIRIDKAVDDRDQKLTQVIPQVEGGAGIGGNAAIALPGAIGGMNAPRLPNAVAQRINWGGLSQQTPVQLKKGAKEAKALKELKGTIAAQLLTEARPLITADKLDKAGDKIFKGSEGGSIKIVNVTSEESQTIIRLELEHPPFDKVVPAQAKVVAGNVIRLVAPPLGAKAQPAPLPLNGGAALGGPVPLLDSMDGLSIQDDKGNTLPIDGRRSRRQGNIVLQANGAARQTVIYTLTCPHGKDKNKPAKVVYLGRKRVTVEIPFVLKDVPLP